MGEAAIAPHLYSEAIQLKLYQAFIFSIPILFSIILFLLFYLFYLKKRASTLSSSSSSMLPVTSNYPSASSHVPSIGVIVTEKELKEKLPVVVFDEELRTRNSQCCVCLGEFEMKEELNQVPNCKHIFHGKCIHLWLHSNSTCPLCRSPLLTISQPHAASV